MGLSSAHQHTLASKASWRGIGLHTGVVCGVSVSPGAVGSGVRIVRTDDTRWGGPAVLSPDLVTQTQLCSAITRNATTIMTVEHILSALSALGVDNALIEVDGPEIPALDGSAAMFVAGLRRARLKRQNAPRRAFRINRAFDIRDGERWARVEPCDGFEVDVSIDFDDDAIGAARFVGPVNGDIFERQVAPARTFAMRRDVDALRAAGLARGGSLDNCVVVDEGRVVNVDGLRFSDEFVRHKTLDLIGDLFALGMPILGRCTVHRPGHGINNAIARAIVDHSDIVVLGEKKAVGVPALSARQAVPAVD